MEKNGGIYIVRGTVPIYGEIGILVYCEQHRGYTGGCVKKKTIFLRFLVKLMASFGIY